MPSRLLGNLSMGAELKMGIILCNNKKAKRSLGLADLTHPQDKKTFLSTQCCCVDLCDHFLLGF